MRSARTSYRRAAAVDQAQRLAAKLLDTVDLVIIGAFASTAAAAASTTLLLPRLRCRSRTSTAA